MQRRAAAAYVAIFVLLAVGSYAVIATAEAPAIQLRNPDYELQANESFRLGGTEYTLDSIERAESGGGHGAAATVTTEGTLVWTESVQGTLELSNNSTVRRGNANWTVVIPQASNPSRFRLVEAGAADPRTRTVREGDSWNDTATVANVTADAATVTYPTTAQRSETLAEGANVTLGGTQFTAHFPDAETLQLTRNYERYAGEVAKIDRFERRIVGLWAVSIMSGLAAVVMVGMAYLPRRR